ncbi:MAG TPA: hypothetical protein VLL98_04360 [Rickettsiales bacterium]|nr:hypothetical protein [Rickettsiales bacterium]
MKILLVTGTMGSGKSKYIFDFLESNSYGFAKSEISCFKNIAQTRDGYVIKSLAYPTKQIRSYNISDICDVLKSSKRCIIVDEYQYFSPENLKTGISKINQSNCELLILAGLQYYANGNEWESIKAVKDTAQDLKIELEIIEMKDHKCDSVICINPAKYHKLKSELGTRRFEDLSVKDYDFLCTPCWVEFVKKKEEERIKIKINYNIF